VTTRGGTLAALLAALGRPSWWILALAGFLVRGGILVFIVAIVTLPSPLALSNVLAPLITPLYFGRLEPATAGLIIGAVGSIATWIVAGCWFAAATEVVLVRDARQAAIDEGLPVGAGRPPGRLLISRTAAAHLLALVPMLIAIAVGSFEILSVTYRELVNPSDASPIVLRVVSGAAAQLAIIVVAWVLGELVGGMAVRRIVLGGEPIVGAVLRSAVDLVRRPLGSLLAPLGVTVILVIDLVAVLMVVAIVWTHVRIRLIQPLEDPGGTSLALVTLGAGWCLALLVTGLIEAWRSVAMTFEAERVAAGPVDRAAVSHEGQSHPDASGGGTIGAPEHRRPGDWSAADRGGSL
jgi:hypothetical protein